MSTDRRPLSKRIEMDEEVRDIQVPTAVEVVLITSAKLSEMHVLERVIDLAMQDVKARFEKEGFKLHTSGGNVRPMGQDELVALLPRKVHLSFDGEKNACSTEYVARKNLTDDFTKVTCKLCIAAVKRSQKEGEQK